MRKCACFGSWATESLHKSRIGELSECPAAVGVPVLAIMLTQTSNLTRLYIMMAGRVKCNLKDYLHAQTSTMQAESNPKSCRRATYSLDWSSFFATDSMVHDYDPVMRRSVTQNATTNGDYHSNLLLAEQHSKPLEPLQIFQ